MKNAIIGIDQSYTDTGIAIAVGGKILAAISLSFDKIDYDTEKRILLKNKLHHAINLCYNNGYKPIVYFEQVRINKNQTTFNYMKRAGAMESVIIDLCYSEKLECRSVSSNSWKAKVLGSRKKIENEKGIAPEKYIAYEYTHKLGLDKFTLQPCSNRTENYLLIDKRGTKLKYNDNIGDAICISLYGCLPQKDQVYQTLVERS